MTTRTKRNLYILTAILAFVTAALFGKFQIFLWTSVAGALFDLLFVILQRYNRPRVMRLRQADTVALYYTSTYFQYVRTGYFATFSSFVMMIAALLIA